MRIQLEKLRRRMQEVQVDAYLIPTTDFHGSEYVNAYFKCREYISGFTGSAGTLLVLKDEAKLWTDGRYFLQAAEQLSGSGIDLMKEREPGVPSLKEYLLQQVPAGSCLGFDGRVINYREGKSMDKTFRVRSDLDLVGDIWTERPQLKGELIYPVPESVTGESMEEKLSRIRDIMRQYGADYHFTSKLEEIAWICNLRGNDVAHTPVFFAFALISQDNARFYVFDQEFGRLSSEQIKICYYEQIYEDLKQLSEGTLLLDETVASYTAVSSVAEHVKIIHGMNPVELMKAIKNKTEISASKHAHIQDGVAMAEFIYWLKSNKGRMDMTELSVSNYLEKCRRRQRGCYDLSFNSIVGYQEHGAVMHYSPSTETDKKLECEGFLLVDSGGQYQQGTTDITRTFAMGTLTETMKKHYTLVLKCHIALATAKFPAGTSGAELDRLTRKIIREAGLDYNHGTGHGVGHLLSVHEGPNTISYKGENCTILPGMISSNEPGLYFEGEYGIRLENEILCIDLGKGIFGFETITFCPWEREAILTEMLSTEELEWINTYHREVYEKLSPYLDDDVKSWLAEETRPLQNGRYF